VDLAPCPAERPPGPVFGRWKGVLALTLWTAACGSPPGVKGPRETLGAYAQAVEQGRVEAAYALFSDEAKKSISYEAFARMVRENGDEMRALAQALVRPSSPALVTATVTTGTGRELMLVWEDGKWQIDGSALDLYGQKTPESAVRAFLRAYRNRRFDILLRFVPSSEAEGLDTAKLRKAWEGEQRAEMDRLTQALEAALPTARFERIGNRATMTYAAGGTVEMVEEAGAWKIEDLR
jgi:hypothetical protein